MLGFCSETPPFTRVAMLIRDYQHMTLLS